MQSESVKELAAALAQARAKFEAVKKTREVRFPGREPYKYAPLDAVYDAVIPALSAAGVVVVHQTEWSENVLTLVTKLLHKSGEWIGSAMPIATGKMQEMGSALTYSKRYQLSGLLAIAAEDDDDAQGADAQKGKPGRKPEPKAAPMPAHSEDAAKAFFAAAKAKGMTTDEIKALLWEFADVERSADVPPEKWGALMTAVQDWQRQ